LYLKTRNQLKELSNVVQRITNCSFMKNPGGGHFIDISNEPWLRGKDLHL